MMKSVSMLAGLSLALGDTSILGGAPTLNLAKARKSKAAFAKSAVTPGAKHKSQTIRSNRRKAKTRSKRWK
nr:hypothetical protein [uncultured Campylobacter sp.]